MNVILPASVLVIAFSAYLFGSRRGAALRGRGERVHSLPVYHGAFVALAAALPLLALIVVWPAVANYIIEHRLIEALPQSMQPADGPSRAALLQDISNTASSEALAEGALPEIQAAAKAFKSLSSLSTWSEMLAVCLLALLGLMWSVAKIQPSFRAQSHVEGFVKWTLMACSAIAVLTTVGIVASVLFEFIRFFAQYPIFDFLFGTKWSPQIAMRSDQVGQSGAFGILPLFAGTMLITLIAITVAAPTGLFAAIYMAEYASPRMRAIVKPMLEILAGIPTVVFGFFAAITVAPLIRSIGQSLGLDVASESALAAGLVMGIMIIPFVSSLSDDVINAVPQSLRDGAYALGSTKSEAIKKVVLPAALPGIVSAIMLAISRAVGETMIVVMAAGLTGNLTFNPLEAVTTITVQIKTLLVGDQEFDSAKTLSAFALGLVLFVFTLLLNWIALRIVGKYREQYE